MKLVIGIFVSLVCVTTFAKNSERKPASLFQDCKDGSYDKKLQYSELSMVKSNGVKVVYVGFSESLEGAMTDAVKKCVNDGNDRSVCDVQNLVGDVASSSADEERYLGIMAAKLGCKKAFSRKNNKFVDLN